MTMAETVKHPHPIRGVLWGLMFGIGLTLVLVFTTVIGIDLVPMILITLAAVAAGTAWSLYGPAKAPKGPPPAPPVHSAPESSRFDDVSAGTGPPPEPLTAPSPTSPPPPAAPIADTAVDADADTGADRDPSG